MVEARCVVEESSDFPGGGGEIVAADGGSGFKKMIGVALFLSGDGFDEGHGEGARERFGSCEAAGLADEEIGGGHVAIHFVSEADGDKAMSAAGQFAGAIGEPGHLLTEFFGFSGNGDDLPIAFEREQAGDELFHGADAVAAGGDQQNLGMEIEFKLATNFGAIDRGSEERVDRNSGNADDFTRDTDLRKVFRGFVERDVKAVNRLAEPHGMNIVVGDDDGVARDEFLLGAEPGDDFGREKMGGNAKIGLDALEQADHRRGVEAVKGETALHGAPGLVGAVVEDSHQVRRVLHHFDVGLVV